LATAARGVTIALAMALACLSYGMLPAAMFGAANESESSQEEGPASSCAAVPSDHGTRVRRSLPQRRHAAELTSRLPATGQRLARNLACSIAAPQLSLGLSVPLRC
jgi:hypothetical protein